MQPIHVAPEQLYDTARAFWREHLDMVEEIYALRTSMYRLEMDWQGPDAEQFTTEMSRLIERLNRQVQDVLSLGLILSRQGEMWDESDQRWTWNYRSLAR